jgi:hypothetical protein
LFSHPVSSARLAMFKRIRNNKYVYKRRAIDFDDCPLDIPATLTYQTLFMLKLPRSRYRSD